MNVPTPSYPGIRARAAAATPGPWHREHATDGSFGCIAMGDYGWIAGGPNWPHYDEDSAEGRADAEFIAHAREDIPALLDAIDRVREVAAELEAEGETAQLDIAYRILRALDGDL